MKLKNVKARIKIRKSTPAPPLKSNGRKRFVPSPLPEDKQLRKKLTFGGDNSPNDGSPKCKSAIFTSHSTQLEEGRSSDVSSPLREDGPRAEDPPTDTSSAAETPTAGYMSGSTAGTDEASEDKTPNGHQGVIGEASIGQMSLDIVEVNLPKMVETTNPLFESTLAPNHIEPSRDFADFASQMQPKFNPLLQLASLNSAETMDTMVAQPLLAGQPPVVYLYGKNPYLTNTRSANLATNQPSLPNNLPYEDYPPLERGRIRKLRDSSKSGPTALRITRLGCYDEPKSGWYAQPEGCDGFISTKYGDRDQPYYQAKIYGGYGSEPS